MHDKAIWIEVARTDVARTDVARTNRTTMWHPTHYYVVSKEP